MEQKIKNSGEILDCWKVRLKDAIKKDKNKTSEKNDKHSVKKQET